MKKTFKMNGWIYEYNEPMTSNWGWPEGRKGERTRILKKQMLQLLKERDAFKTPFEEIAEDPQEAPSAPTEPAEAKHEEPEGVEKKTAESGAETAKNIAVSIPAEDYTPENLRNLINLVYTRAGLINKALGTRFSISDEMIACTDDFNSIISGEKNNLCSGITFGFGKICFCAYIEPDKISAFMELISAMNSQAVTQKRIQAKKVKKENEKYAMRIWLTRLGMNGPEYKETRRILMQNLSGHAAFRTEAEKQRWMEKHTAKKEG